MKKRFNEDGYSGLSNPSDKFFALTVFWVQMFEYFFYNMPYMNNVCKSICDKINKAMLDDKKYSWFTDFTHEHANNILEKFIMVCIIYIRGGQPKLVNGLKFGECPKYFDSSLVLRNFNFDRRLATPTF
jgi:hypothetical protein